ncbi:hypothetical protein CDAR_573231 [Caerostris darwini]|uniref:Uncharacterized protein n=1 Tax=Caerostris darwini TaxID=1538125 RepID=A0AAV4UM15_9ARAC|nr:hypothetical protein CDAR_573231 [Caerostris darwini]
MGIGTSVLAFTPEVILDILESVGALDLLGFSESGTAVWTLSAGAGEAFAAVVLSGAGIGGGVAGYLHSLSEITGPIKDTDLNWVRKLLEKMSRKVCRKRPLQQRLGWGVMESIDKEEKILKRNVWFGGKDKEILIKRLKLPNAAIVAEAEEAKCVKPNKDYFWTWELFATDIYRRPTSNNAKSPFFFSYAFHHDGIAIAKFNTEGKEPTVERVKESFDNSAHHWDKKFHPFIQNQWVYSTYCESSVVALPPVTWLSNQFRITTDDSGIGVLLTKG